MDLRVVINEYVRKDPKPKGVTKQTPSGIKGDVTPSNASKAPRDSVDLSEGQS